MKKFKQTKIFICAALVVLLSACRRAETQEIKEPETTSTVSEINQEDILLKITEANKKENLLKNHDQIAFIIHCKYINGDQQVTTDFIYQDKDKSVLVSEYGAEKSVTIDRSGNVVKYYPSTQEYSKCVFANENAYEDFKQNHFMTSYYYNPLESLEVTSIKEEGDLLIVEAEEIDAETVANAKSFHRYEVNAKTYELYKKTHTYDYGNGKIDVMESVEQVENYEEYMPSQEILNYDISNIEKQINFD